MGHQQIDGAVAESAGQRRDHLADHLVVGAHVLRRSLRDDLGRPHGVALSQERQHRQLHIRPVRASPEADHPSLIGGPDRSGQDDAGYAHQRPVGLESRSVVMVAGDDDDFGARLP